MITAPPERPARRAGVLRLSKDPEVRSIQVGVAATILIHLLILLVAPYLLRTGLTHPIKQDADKQLFNIELAPPDEPQPEPPKPANPFKFVETNPDAPDNPPDKTDNFAAQNQQVAQEKPTPNGTSEKPAIEGQTKIHSDQIVSGQLTKPVDQPPPEPPVEAPPQQSKTMSTRPEQNPLAGYEKKIGDDADAFGSNIAPEAKNTKNIPKKIEGQKDAPLIEGTSEMQPAIDPHHPRPRQQLVKTVHSRPAIFEENKFGTRNIGAVAVNAKFNNYGAYLQRLIDAVQQQWDRALMDSRIFPPQGSVVHVRFMLNAEGKIAAIEEVKSESTTDAFERLCVTAITARAPYGEWTDDMKAVLGDQQELIFSFYIQ